jgi:hypothetical protein
MLYSQGARGPQNIGASTTNQRMEPVAGHNPRRHVPYENQHAAASARAAWRASLRPLVLPTLVIEYGAASVVVALKAEFLTTYGATSWIAAATG